MSATADSVGLVQLKPLKERAGKKTSVSLFAASPSDTHKHTQWSVCVCPQACAVTGVAVSLSSARCPTWAVVTRVLKAQLSRSLFFFLVRPACVPVSRYSEAFCV